jgi:hypothetical protein
MRVQYDDAIRESHGFADRVGNEEDSLLGFDPEGLKPPVHVGAGLGVEGGEGFVHEQDSGVDDHCAGDGNALPHAAGEFVDEFIGAAGEMDHGQGVGDALRAIAP